MHNAAYSLAASAVGPVFSCISVTLTGHSSGPCRAAYACCFFARLSTPIHRSGKLRAKCFHEKKSSQSRDPSPQYNLDCRCIERTLHKHMQPGYKIPYFKSSSRFQAASTFFLAPQVLPGTKVQCDFSHLHLRSTPGLAGQSSESAVCIYL